MTARVRTGAFDVVVLAGPRVSIWPSVGVRALSLRCAEAGLTVGQFGGEDLRVRGVLPLQGTGGWVIAEDIQGRVHRIHARAVVRVALPEQLPDPFEGWRTQGLIPLSTAERLQGRVEWNPGIALLGTGNRALTFGAELLEKGVAEVNCIEPSAQWGGKRFAGWEVNRRRFEMAGGKILEAKPLSLTAKSALLWNFRVSDARGVRLLEVSRVISAGPFLASPGVREYPPSSLLFELEQTAMMLPQEEIEGWKLEEDRGLWLANKIVRALGGDRGKASDQAARKVRTRVKAHQLHRERPFTPGYQGKWMASTDMRVLRQFSGVPKQEVAKRAVASIECVEDIGCDLCARACPTQAITLGALPRSATLPVLKEDLCNACGLCVTACPSRSVALIHEPPERPQALLTLARTGADPWEPGDLAQLFNRRGDPLGSGRIKEVQPRTLQVEVPTHLTWEARTVRKTKVKEVDDDPLQASLSQERAGSTPKVEIQFEGERRLVRDKIPVTQALFEIGQARAEDILFCADGSCGLCHILVDGTRKLACQEPIHPGMSIRIEPSPSPAAADQTLCPCLQLSSESLLTSLSTAQPRSAEAAISRTHVGEGRCHGQLCMGGFRRLVDLQGDWLDWRFPWADWRLPNG